jgi:hypothetical protein
MPRLNSPLIRQQPDRVVGRGDETVRAVLVEHDWDRVGLLAMAIYEQHRRDWITNYRQEFGRGPDEYACHVFELAEHTPRRRIREDASERQVARRSKQRMRFIGPYPLLADAGSGCCL